MKIEHLPIKIDHLGQIDTSKIQPHGLLYLENKYVVPGGRFNEMYGWDSYFIILGLLRAGRVELARGMVDNFLFEIEQCHPHLLPNPLAAAVSEFDGRGYLRGSGEEWSDR